MKFKSQLQTHALHDLDKPQKNFKSEIISRDLIDKVNEAHEKSDRLTVARLDSIVKGTKQNYKSNLMTENIPFCQLNHTH